MQRIVKFRGITLIISLQNFMSHVLFKIKTKIYTSLMYSKIRITINEACNFLNRTSRALQFDQSFKLIRFLISVKQCQHFQIL